MVRSGMWTTRAVCWPDSIRPRARNIRGSCSTIRGMTRRLANIRSSRASSTRMAACSRRWRSSRSSWWRTGWPASRSPSWGPSTWPRPPTESSRSGSTGTRARSGRNWRSDSPTPSSATPLPSAFMTMSACGGRWKTILPAKLAGRVGPGGGAIGPPPPGFEPLPPPDFGFMRFDCRRSSMASVMPPSPPTSTLRQHRAAHFGPPVGRSARAAAGTHRDLALDRRYPCRSRCGRARRALQLAARAEGLR